MASPWYVTHNAGGGGVGTEGDPFTLTQAIDTVAAGETVYVKASGDYTTEYATGGAKDTVMYLVTNGAISTPIYWIGYHTTIADGGIVTIDATDTLANAFNMSSTIYQVFRNFVFKRGTADSVNAAGSPGTIWINCSFQDAGDDGCDSPDQQQFINCRFINNDDEGVEGGTNKVTFINCIISGNLGNGIVLTAGSLWVNIINCIFFNNVGFAINLGMTEILIVGCTIDGDNTGGGIRLFGSIAGTNPVIVDNIIHDCVNGIDINDYYKETVRYGNLFYSNTSDVVNTQAVSPGDGIGNNSEVEAVPGFENEVADDYTLGSGSAAIGAGWDANKTTQMWASYDDLDNPPVLP